MPVLNLIDPALAEDVPRMPQLGLVDRCRKAWGWFQEFVKEAGEYTGAHVLSMVRAHYPLIDLKRLEAGYPKEVDPDKAEELRMTQLDLSAKIIGDINLCGRGTAPVQGTPSTSQLETPSVLSQRRSLWSRPARHRRGHLLQLDQYKSPQDSSTMSGLASSRCRVTRPANSIG